MFTGFTKETSNFLWELAFNNERPWFQEHKEEFERVLNKPFKALSQQTYDLMAEKYPKLQFRLHISRIYRDARRLFGRGPYKDHMWFSIATEASMPDGPMFWFEIGASDYAYGVGFFGATATEMAAYRKAIDANPAAFERMAKKAEAGGHFRLDGREYVRPKADRGEYLNKWYNRRSVGLEYRGEFDELLMMPDLPQILRDDYVKLMPLHNFFEKVYCAAKEEKNDN